MQTHGKQSTYKRGCRCDECREAWRLRMKSARELRRERFAAGLVEVNHGAPWTAREYGCRCDPCVEANRARVRELRGGDPRRVFTEEEIASALVVYATAGRKAAAAAAGVCNETVRRWARARGVECYRPPKKHGTRSTWWRGCRCDVCREGMREENKRNKARRVAKFRAGLLHPVHGSTSTYSNYDCRCEPCRAAWSVLMRARTEQRKAA